MRRRTLTAEQETARDARRARFSELAKQIAGMTDDERAVMAGQMAATTIEGRTLSPRNACLVALQNPTATLVGGFNQWRTAGRFVRKGEHGIQIWAPTARRTAAPTAAGAEVSTADDSDRPSFITITVFDVSQTEEAGQ